MPKIFLFKPRQDAFFIHGIEKIEYGGGKRLIVVEWTKPGDGLFIGHIKRNGDFWMNALEKTDRDRVGDRVRQLFVFHLLQQRSGTQLLIDFPAQIRIFFLFQGTQIVNDHMARRDGELLIVERGHRTWTNATDAIHHLLRNRIVCRARLIVFATLTVIHQPSGQ
ncbi:hypothetical protein D3C78_1240890 [compost metagenome]